MRAHRVVGSYLAASLGARALVFAGLVAAAARLPDGSFARFALAYQVALTVAYQVAYPSVIGAYREGALAAASTLRGRVASAALTSAAVSALGVALLAPGATVALCVATAVYGGAAAAGVIVLGQAQAAGRALTFARLSAAGSLAFLALAVLPVPAEPLLLAAAVGIGLAPAALLLRPERWRPTADAAVEPAAGTGARSTWVFVSSTLYAASFPLLLVVASQSLTHSEADQVAIAATLLQAALAIPMQFLSYMQPQLIARAVGEFLRRVLVTQTWLATCVMLGGLALAAAGTSVGSDWAAPFGPIAVSSLPLAAGLAAGNAAMLATGARGVRLIAGPIVLTGGFVIAARWTADEPAALAATWLVASCVGAAVQLTGAHIGGWRLLLAALTAIGAGALALLVVSPVLGIAAVAVTAVFVARPVRAALGEARTMLATTR